MKLVVLELSFGLDVADAGSLLHGEDAVVDDPLRAGVVLRGDPFVEIRAVEEMDGVRGRSLVGCAGRDDRWLGGPDFGLFGLWLGRGGLSGRS